ncbi:MAG: cysteine hydrolase family protein [Planctomycetes bacterium]|nr:cysteine hydrolase family protein [Planctomycetota bacterium]MBL7042739.1 cysteine hydrolase family protein [Pirellulaceae bacterium]
MDASTTALVMIGYQNDYFAPDGVLREAIEDAQQVAAIRQNTVELVAWLSSTPTLMVTTPIVFTPDYSELKEPVGILKAVKEVGAFKAGTSGAETIPELRRFGKRILEVPGKRGLNAFSNTELDAVLQGRGISDVVLAGAVTSICVDSTGRSAHERGFRVNILSDCTCGRTSDEQEFYCENIFPLYARVLDRQELRDSLRA